MELSDEPKSWVEEARNRVKRISDLDPRDRLDIVYGIGLCCSTLAKSMQGWMQWIGNLSLKDFEQRELEEIFGIIKKATVQLMELDIDKTSKYEESHGLRQKPQDLRMGIFIIPLPGRQKIFSAPFFGGLLPVEADLGESSLSRPRTGKSSISQRRIFPGHQA